MSGDVTIGLAFIAGLISFISPCVLPLVPAYVGYMGGRMTQQVTDDTRSSDLRKRFGTFIHGIFFVLGFTLFFVVFGLLTTAAVSSLTSLGVTESDVREGIARIGGTAVILFGLHIMGLLNRAIAWLMKQAGRLDQHPYGNVISLVVALALLGATYWLFVESWFMTLLMVLLFTQVFNNALKADTPGDFWLRILTQLQTAFYVDTRRQGQPQNQRYGYLSSLFMGVVFSAGWTPCIGPIYGAVLTLASTGGSISEAGILLTAYSLGLGIPFLLTALALDQAQGVLHRLQKNMRMIEIFSGVFLLLIGVLVFTGQMERLARLGSEGELGQASLNMENCTVGTFEGRVRAGNWLNCVRDGEKEDFYIVLNKGPRTQASAPVEVAELPATAGTDFTASVPGPDIPALGNDLNTASAPGPELSAGLPGNDLSVPELAPDLDTDAAETPADAAPGNIAGGLEAGQRAPDFSAEMLDGSTLSLSDLRGQVVLVNFWATWCGPCRVEMPDFQTVYDLYETDGFVVLAVNYEEGQDTVADFANDLDLTFPVMLDTSGTINAQLYQVAEYPTSFLLDRNGVIV
ncbi:MAG: redoxin domain-containing protein, partial [Anaerolineae bacterium]|nr:redoxin domain-containing protein [Anaerolineae bacterium]